MFHYYFRLIESILKVFLHLCFGRGFWLNQQLIFFKQICFIFFIEQN